MNTRIAAGLIALGAATAQGRPQLPEWRVSATDPDGLEGVKIFRLERR
jgi:hypothetical protein